MKLLSITEEEVELEQVANRQRLGFERGRAVPGACSAAPRSASSAMELDRKW